MRRIEDAYAEETFDPWVDEWWEDQKEDAVQTLSQAFEKFIEAALQAEMDAHLETDERKGGNKRNDKSRKTMKVRQVVSRSRLRRIYAAVSTES